MVLIRTLTLAAALSLAFAGAALAAPAKTKAKARPAAAAKAVPAALAAGSTESAPKGEDADALRRAAQNPVANMISLPLQNNTNFSYGRYKQDQNVLNFQPVIPIKINDDWNLITRWITPLIYQPQLTPTGQREFGLGNLTPSFFLSPAHSGAVIWGAGPILYLPTATDKTLGTNKWGGGPSFVALTIQGPWVLGALVNNIWAGTQNDRVNLFTLQPFINYNLPGGWYLTSGPVITANWLTKNGEKWTVPVGGGFGRLFRLDKLPINAQIQAFYNVVKPTGGADWTLRFQVQALLPAH
jgi:hypothetical protein